MNIKRSFYSGLAALILEVKLCMVAVRFSSGLKFAIATCVVALILFSVSVASILPLFLCVLLPLALPTAKRYFTSSRIEWATSEVLLVACNDLNTYAQDNAHKVIEFFVNNPKNSDAPKEYLVEGLLLLLSFGQFLSPSDRRQVFSLLERLVSSVSTTELLRQQIIVGLLPSPYSSTVSTQAEYLSSLEKIADSSSLSLALTEHIVEGLLLFASLSEEHTKCKYLSTLIRIVTLPNTILHISLQQKLVESMLSYSSDSSINIQTTALSALAELSKSDLIPDSLNESVVEVILSESENLSRNIAADRAIIAFKKIPMAQQERVVMKLLLILVSFELRKDVSPVVARLAVLGKDAFPVVARLAVLDTISEQVKTDTILALLPLLNGYDEATSHDAAEKIIEIASLITTEALKEKFMTGILSLGSKSKHKGLVAELLRDIVNSSIIIPDALRERVWRMIAGNCDPGDRMATVAIKKLTKSTSADSQAGHDARLNSPSPAQGSDVGTKNLFENLKSLTPSP